MLLVDRGHPLGRPLDPRLPAPSSPRSLDDERVLVVATYRADELHRRHPLRPLLAELERDAARAPDRARAASTATSSPSQLADILGARARAPTLVERLYARSEGNPLFTEELLAAGLDGRGGAAADACATR